ncbi:TetR/AcrR family transcriptional regulator [Microtetraspora malaysiensis]|uniref:TetR/AcrR family transcriptional regulator n=1 Tax=Microtetraspora malaysiensis TaxID=161358 RepID=UPI003D8D11AD
MPIEIDITERLEQIAEATLRVAEREGPAAITIRAVAAELGGSTAVVTNYLATRSDLLVNAIRHAQRGWREDLDSHVNSHEGAQHLRAYMEWSSGTVGHDRAVRQIWLDVAAKAESRGAAFELLRQDAVEHHRMLRAAVAEAGVSDADFAADVLYLMLRGFYFASTEDPELWTDERVGAAISRLTDVFIAGLGTRTGGAGEASAETDGATER